MDFSPAPELDEIRAAVRELCAGFPGEYWRALEPDRYPEEFVSALTEHGWLAALIPEEYGGAGLSLTAASVILEEINASGCNSGACHAQMYVMGTILRHGSDAQKREYLPKIASGELRLQAFGVTEPTVGSDTTSIQTTAERVDGGYVVRGQKIWTSRALHSDLMLLLARTTPADEVEKRTEGLSTFIVDMKRAVDAGTMTIRPIRTLMNHATTEIFLDGVEVPADALVGEEGKGFRHILDGMNAERVLIAAECIGDGHWFLDKAARYASERIVFGRPIGQNQGVQFPLARAWAAVEAADLMRYKAAWLFEQGLPCGAEANTAKLLALRGVLGGGERLPRHARRLRLRRGVRRRAEVPGDAPLHGRAGLQQPRARVHRPERPRHAALVLSRAPMARTPEQILEDAGVPFRVHEHTPVATVAEILDALPFPAEEHVKTLAFDADGRIVLAALRGSDRLAYGALARAARRPARPAPPAAARRVRDELGFEPGGVCPLAEGALVVVDRQVLALDRAFCGSGRNDATLELAPADLVAAAGATVTELTRPG